jgi:hypothetical protein
VGNVNVKKRGKIKGEGNKGVKKQACGKITA